MPSSPISATTASRATLQISRPDGSSIWVKRPRDESQFVTVDPAAVRLRSEQRGRQRLAVHDRGERRTRCHARSHGRDWAVSLLVTVDPSGRYAYVANGGGNNLSQYTIGADGSLTPLAAPTVVAGTNPQSVAIDASGKYVYVANDGGTVSQYTVGADGSLAPLSTPSVVAGTNPKSAAVDPSGRYVYVANSGSNTVSQYTIGRTARSRPCPAPRSRRDQVPNPSPSSLPAGTSMRRTSAATMFPVHNRFEWFAHAHGDRHGRSGDESPVHHRRPVGKICLRGEPRQQHPLAVHDWCERCAHGQCAVLRSRPERPQSIAMAKGMTPVVLVPRHVYVANESDTTSRSTRSGRWLARAPVHRYGRGGIGPSVPDGRPLRQIRLRGELHRQTTSRNTRSAPTVRLRPRPPSLRNEPRFLHHRPLGQICLCSELRRRRFAIHDRHGWFAHAHGRPYRHGRNEPSVCRRRPVG